MSYTGMDEREKGKWIFGAVVLCCVLAAAGLVVWEPLAQASAAKDTKAVVKSAVSNMGSFVLAFENPQGPNIRFSANTECGKVEHAWVTYSAVSWQDSGDTASLGPSKHNISLYQRVRCSLVESKSEKRVPVKVCDCKLAL